ncbi:unnamed protein product [Acanthoscelides obtectus]|uniref:Uncharacterized protein n=1 Tax=Acanthoscelides obtectus TaxID=200917 RepID=A0A9P0K5T6_ACAOB|nr:unnamed protein product [Acanthoscelides obtectus]CAK1669971.1 hypothetical protein AOBTE_LOCUS27331 [Acanthoscelides obtectus]
MATLSWYCSSRRVCFGRGVGTRLLCLNYLCNISSNILLLESVHNYIAISITSSTSSNPKKLYICA